MTTTTTTTTTTTSPPACPAKPMLASSLLSQEKRRFTGTQQQQQHHHWRTGLGSLDRALPASLWTGGKVIGIIDDSDRDSDSVTIDRPTGTKIRDRLPLLTRIIVTHLASLDDDNHNTTVSSKPSVASPQLSPPTAAAAAAAAGPAVYIISPHSSSASSTTTTVSHDHPALSATSLAAALDQSALRTTTLLDSVSLLQYFDFTGLTEAVSEVSSETTLHHVNNNNNNNTTTTTTTGTGGRRATHPILILDGLVPTLSALARKSGAVATNALIAPLLRSLTLLSRHRADLLILIKLEPAFLDFLPAAAGAGVGAEDMGAFSSYADKRRQQQQQQQQQPGERRRSDTDDAGVKHPREPGTGMATTATNSNSNPKSFKSSKSWWTSTSTSTSTSSVMNVLATGIDTLVLSHTLDGKDDIVEVLMDRVGDATGRWGVSVSASVP